MNIAPVTLLLVLNSHILKRCILLLVNKKNKLKISRMDAKFTSKTQQPIILRRANPFIENY